MSKRGGSLMVESLWAEDTQAPISVAVARASKLDHTMLTQFPDEWKLEMLHEAVDVTINVQALQNSIEMAHLRVARGGFWYFPSFYIYFWKL